MKIKAPFTLLFVVTLFSNCHKQNDLAYILGNNCYWDVLNIGSPHPTNSCYRFSKNGECNFFYYNFFDKKRTNSVYLYDDADVIVPNKWKLLNDSLLIRANKYYILRYNSDSIFLTFKGDTMILIKNCSTLQK